jgi:hypothetical protein
VVAQDMTPEQLAEARPTTGSHPAVVGRLIEQLQDLAVLLDTSDAVTFTCETQPRLALDALIASATGVVERAERLAVHLPPS